MLSRQRRNAPEPTTVSSTVVPSAIGRGGYRRLMRAPGEPHLVRRDLAPEPSTNLHALCCFIHLSDLHVTDVQSPARAEFLDRLGDEDSPLAAKVGRVGVYRAQEALSAQVVEAMVRSVRSLERGPVTGSRIELALSTGDAADNSQLNELENYLALLDGGSVTPDSGDRSRFEGVGSWALYDRRYWHPEGTPPGESDDIPRSRRGFPVVPGLLDAARASFLAEGLGMPWYAVYGNHDALYGGTLPHLDALGALAIGSVKPTGMDESVDPLPLLIDNERRPSPGLWSLLGGPFATVTADPMRRPVDRAGWIAAHRDGDRDGHGLDSCAASEGRAYYGFDRGAVRFLVLDTVNEQGGWQGSLDEEQFGWLERELAEGSRRHLDREGRTVEHDTTDRLFVLVSHHPLETLVNDYSPNGTRRVLADEVADLLGRFPNVVAWVNGHTHANTVRPVHTAGALGGFWQLTVASHIDWPQQSRVVELALDESTGSIVIVSSMLDHAGILDGRLGALEDPLTLAGWSRELAANAWQGRVGGTPVGRGERLDRNVVCTIPAPFPLEAT